MDGGGISNLASPDDFALMYHAPHRERMVEQMLSLTEHILKNTDTVALHNIGDAMSARFAAACPSLRLLVSSYAERTEIPGGTVSGILRGLMLPFCAKKFKWGQPSVAPIALSFVLTVPPS